MPRRCRYRDGGTPAGVSSKNTERTLCSENGCIPNTRGIESAISRLCLALSTSGAKILQTSVIRVRHGGLIRVGDCACARGHAIPCNELVQHSWHDLMDGVGTFHELCKNPIAQFHLMTTVPQQPDIIQSACCTAHEGMCSRPRDIRKDLALQQVIGTTD